MVKITEAESRMVTARSCGEEGMGMFFSGYAVSGLQEKEL